jgi:hypothetical protein
VERKKQGRKKLEESRNQSSDEEEQDLHTDSPVQVWWILIYILIRHEHCTGTVPAYFHRGPVVPSLISFAVDAGG